MQRMIYVAVGALCALGLGAREASAQEVIAGWDFSQWFADGALSIDGVSLTNTLAANYSNLDPTFNAGAESAAFGRLYFDGQFGSTNVAPTGFADEAFVPFTGSLDANIDAPVQQPGDNPFDSFTILTSEGQPFANELSMLASVEPVAVVFLADLSSVPQTGSGWSISFGAQTRTGGTASVRVDFSADGSSYATVETVDIDAAEKTLTVPLSAASSERAFARLTFLDAGPELQPLIDNVAIHVPEAAASAQAATAIAVLAAALRRRRS